MRSSLVLRSTTLIEEGIRRGQGDRYSSEDHHGVRGLQTPELHHEEEPAQRSRPHRAEEVLPELRQAHGPPRDPLVRGAWPSISLSSGASTRPPSRTWSGGRRSGSS